MTSSSDSEYSEYFFWWEPNTCTWNRSFERIEVVILCIFLSWNTVNQTNPEMMEQTSNRITKSWTSIYYLNSIWKRPGVWLSTRLYIYLYRLATRGLILLKRPVLALLRHSPFKPRCKLTHFHALVYPKYSIYYLSIYSIRVFWNAAVVILILTHSTHFWEYPKALFRSSSLPSRTPICYGPHFPRWY